MTTFFSKLYVYCIVYLILFYIGRWIAPESATSFLLYTLYPLITIALSFIYTHVNGFKIYILPLSSLLFLPSLYVFNQPDILLYVFAYFMATILGQTIGLTTRNFQKNLLKK